MAVALAEGLLPGSEPPGKNDPLRKLTPETGSPRNMDFQTSPPSKGVWQARLG